MPLSNPISSVKDQCGHSIQYRRSSKDSAPSGTKFSLLHQVNNVDKIDIVRGQDVYETVGELKKLGLIT